MFIEKIVIPRGSTNCYICGEKEGQGVVIDPGESPQKIINVINKLDVDIVKIINTHGHFDHIGANKEIKEETGAEILIHEKEKDFLTDTTKNLSIHMGTEVTSPQADKLLQGGDIISFGGIELEVIFTPGHSPGGISLFNKDENILFSGDAIFKMGIGRSDFSTSDQETLYRSIEEKLLILDNDTTVYPGHGQKTTIGHFKKIWKRIKS
mgnify:FL=1